MRASFCNMNYLHGALFLAILFHNTYSTIRIITPVYNRADFIEWQYKGFKKFLLDDDWEFLVFSDANNPKHQKDIKDMCDKFGIAHISVPQDLHQNAPYPNSAPHRHGRAIQFALEHSGFYHDDIIMTIDSDVFLIRNFSIRDYLGDCAMMGPTFQPNFFFMNPSKLENPEKINFRAIGGDPGVEAEKYVQANYKHVKFKQRGPAIQDLKQLGLDVRKDMIPQLLNMDFSPLEAELISEIIKVNNGLCGIGFYEKNIFLDYKHGSGWRDGSPSIMNKKNQLIKQFFATLFS